MIENLIKKKQGESAIVTLTLKRIRLNLNMFCMFTGRLGSGKSWSGISYAQELDPNFDVDKQVVFDFRQCMNLINTDWFKAKKIKCIVWDEPQISISNRAWQSQMNKLVNFLISTFRHQNIVLIMCAPYKDFLDSQTMKLLHWEFQCSKIDRRENRCIIYPRYQQYNPQKKKTYPHQLFILEGDKQVPISAWAIKKPDKEAIAIYEKNKSLFTAGLNKSIQNALDTMDKQPEMEQRGNRKPLTELQEKIVELHSQGLNQKQIAEKLKKTPPEISNNVKFMRNKGYMLGNNPNNPNSSN